MKRRKLELAIAVIIHIMTAFLSGAIAIFFLRIYSKLTPQFRAGNMWVTAVLPVVISECIAMMFSFYNGKYKFEKSGVLYFLLKALKETVYFAGVWGAMLIIQKNSISQSRYFFLSTLALHFVILFLLTYFIQKTIIPNFYKTGAATLVVIIAIRDNAAWASDVIKKDWSRKIAGIMLFDEESGEKDSDSAVIRNGLSTDPSSVGNTPREEIDHVPVIAYGKDIVDCVRRSAIDEVFIFNSDNEKVTEDLIEEFAQMGISVHVYLHPVDKMEQRLNDEKQQNYIPKIETRLGFIENCPLAILETPAVKLRYEFAKRIMDILGGIVGSALAIILYVFVGIAIKMDSPGPVIFSHERIGKNGRRFRMYNVYVEVCNVLSYGDAAKTSLLAF